METLAPLPPPQKRSSDEQRKIATADFALITFSDNRPLAR